MSMKALLQSLTCEPLGGQVIKCTDLPSLPWGAEPPITTFGGKISWLSAGEKVVQQAILGDRALPSILIFQRGSYLGTKTAVTSGGCTTKSCQLLWVGHWINSSISVSIQKKLNAAAAFQVGASRKEKSSDNFQQRFSLGEKKSLVLSLQEE